MATSKDDIKYGAAQAKLSEDEALRVRYKHGTPLEGGKIADSEPADLFSSAHNIEQGRKIIADSHPVELFYSAQKVSDKGSNQNNPSSAHDSQLKPNT